MAWKPTERDKQRMKPVIQRLSEIEYDLASNVSYASHPEVDLPVEAEIQVHYDKEKLKLIRKLMQRVAKLNTKEKKDLKKVV